MIIDTYKKKYFPPVLRKVLNGIVEHPVTLILAGSGFGKTTAVASRLEQCSKDIRCRWYTCFGEPPERAWAGICRLIAFADAKVGDFLSKIELPVIDHLGYIASLMEDINCEEETVLVGFEWIFSGCDQTITFYDIADNVYRTYYASTLYEEFGNWVAKEILVFDR